MEVYSVAQMTSYFTQNYYKMTDENLKNFNNKRMLSKECSAQRKSWNLSTKWLHFKISLSNLNFNTPEKKKVLIFVFNLQDLPSGFYLLRMHGDSPIG